MAMVPVRGGGLGLAFTPDGSKLYVATPGFNRVTVLDAATNTVITTVRVGAVPFAFGVFIQPNSAPPPEFAGTPGQSNCFGQSVTALTSQYGGLNAAAAGLGFSNAAALQNAILTFCLG